MESTPDKTKTDFHVVCYEIHKEDGPDYVHWSDNLNMVIMKNGVKIKLNHEEIELLVKSLPKTIGGTY